MTSTPPRRRGLRDWAVDTGLFAFAVLVGLLAAAERADAPMPPHQEVILAVDQLTGVLGCAAVWVRRRRPVTLAIVLIAVSTYSEFVSGAALVAVFTVAVHRPPLVSVRVFGLTQLSGVVFVAFRLYPGDSALTTWLIGVSAYSAAVGWGLFIHHRRQLILSLRDRAARAETEARLRAEQAQHAVRDTLAREIHDVLGHRLSLLSVHAGALGYNRDASPEEVARAAEVIRENAHRALQDLREVIGILRAPVGELPQPTLADVRELAAEAAEAGTRVSVDEDLADAIPEVAGRTVYRIVQESLTNVRKHAPGAAAHVLVRGAPGEGLTVEVRSTLPATAPESRTATARKPGPGADAADPGAAGPVGAVAARGAEPVDRASGPSEGGGVGLVGLGERVALLGGRLAYGPTSAGGWQVSAWLPWHS
ncbi:Signal transduction histidine kinase [Sinosporangium album]|uniref:histidine kinase n=1 Tax=Sinosporangium album TaxID=504805 RepID=A0A1G8IUT4_9ACTN|nr:histidine kinase [Sinosporangium album]SDI22230.1 Signal transduction histidine kinase [Sinosporangium album]